MPRCGLRRTWHPRRVDDAHTSGYAGGFSEAVAAVFASRRGQTVRDLEHELTALSQQFPRHELDAYRVGVLARTFADEKWARHHPAQSVAFAWRHRNSGTQRGFFTCLVSVWRPSVSG